MRSIRTARSPELEVTTRQRCRLGQEQRRGSSELVGHITCPERQRDVFRIGHLQALIHVDERVAVRGYGSGQFDLTALRNHADAVLVSGMLYLQEQTRVPRLVVDVHAAQETDWREERQIASCHGGCITPDRSELVAYVTGKLDECCRDDVMQLIRRYAAKGRDADARSAAGQAALTWRDLTFDDELSALIAE